MDEPVNVRAEFRFVRLNAVGIIKANDIANRFSHLLSFLENSGICLQGRELEYAKKHLEEAADWAEKAMERDVNNQKQPAEDPDAE